MTYKQERRRLSREAKQAEWKAANPLLVGVSAKPQRQVLTLNRKAMSRVEKAVETETEYMKQIVAAASAYTGPEFDTGCCLPEISLYRAGHRKTLTVTAR
ncbi:MULTISPECIES: transcriptional antitermination N peptide [unclassified Cedecea]|uniref:transcriptional antitermination N peptide n=1 Tax=unclassified Cedecea TaxID=2649846 RepID=UPI003017557A